MNRVLFTGREELVSLHGPHLRSREWTIIGTAGLVEHEAFNFVDVQFRVLHIERRRLINRLGRARDADLSSLDCNRFTKIAECTGPATEHDDLFRLRSLCYLRDLLRSGEQ